MARGDLELSEISINNFPFKMDEKRLIACFFYVHHDRRIESINENLKRLGYRPINPKEMEIFFEKYQDLLQEDKYLYCVFSTDSQFIKMDEKGNCIVPSIFRRDINDPFKLILCRILGDFIVGHENNMVIGIKI